MQTRHMTSHTKLIFDRDLILPADFVLVVVLTPFSRFLLDNSLDPPVSRLLLFCFLLFPSTSLSDWALHPGPYLMNNQIKSIVQLKIFGSLNDNLYPSFNLSDLSSHSSGNSVFTSGSTVANFGVHRFRCPNAWMPNVGHSGSPRAVPKFLSDSAP